MTAADELAFTPDPDDTLPGFDAPPRPAKLTAADVASAVRRHYGCEIDSLAPEWAALEELSSVGVVGQSRADLFLVRAWSGRPKGHERHLVEIKVSRSDLRSELAKPGKLWQLGQYAHQMFIATPAGLVTDEVLPETVGLLEVHPHGVLTTRTASMRDPEPLPEGIVVEAFRRASRAAARLRHAGDGSAEELVNLRAEVARSRDREIVARQAADRDRSRLMSWLRLVGQAGGARCACGAKLKRQLDPYRGRLEHADGEEITGCRWPEVDIVALGKALGLEVEG